MGLNPKNGKDKIMEQSEELEPVLEKIKKDGLASGSRPINLETNMENGDNTIRNNEGSEQRIEGNDNQSRSISMAEKGKKKDGQGFDKLKIKKGDDGILGRGMMSFHRLKQMARTSAQKTGSKKVGKIGEIGKEDRYRMKARGGGDTGDHCDLSCGWSQRCGSGVNISTVEVRDRARVIVKR
ncbi:hypothetical protein L6452_00576 [Arctium lappa]|uniref:Uncharacterized protein n=1 Tax=Arctium lappa TaxID=4217 RepID=A0ACB9FF89_ARCLA|nr:hypothetical protein L6452_00576 [Arctium lappa]